MALPILRVIMRNPPSPTVLARVRDLERRALAAKAAGRADPVRAVVSTVVERLVDRQAGRLDRVERPPVTSKPPTKWSFYNVPGGPKMLRGRSWWERAKALGRARTVPALTSGELRALPAIPKRHELPAAKLVRGPRKSS